MPAERITLAAVAGAHGVGGEVRLKLFAQGIDSLSRHKEVAIGDAPFTLTSARAGGQGAIARFAEVGSREAAEALRGQLVTVARSALPPLADGEFYYGDLLGLACTTRDGAAAGRVIAVENYGAGDILEIERPNGGTVMVPFQAPAVDIEGDRIIVDPAYLD